MLLKENHFEVHRQTEGCENTIPICCDGNLNYDSECLATRKCIRTGERCVPGECV